MRIDLSVLRNWNRTIDRLPYLLAGAGLFLVKFCLDWTVARLIFGRPWSPYNYLIWPDETTLRVFDLQQPDRAFSLTFLAMSLPFIWIGVLLTVQRLRAAQLPVALIVFFFVPVLNLLLFLILSIVPTRPVEVEAVETKLELEHWRRLRKQHRQVTGEGAGKSALLAIAVSVPATVALVVLGAQVLQSYGFGIFVGAPFFLGMSSVVLFGLSRPQSFGTCLLVATGAATLAGLAVLVLAFEGLICLIMAAPIAYFLAFLGAVVGYAIQARPWLSRDVPYLCLAMLVFLPALTAAESVGAPEPETRAVRTAVTIAAPPEQVWQYVIAFPELPEPDSLLFKSGIAYPERAEIHGSGVGAVRHCVFSTGAFVEPIDVWDPPQVLRFRVTDQPEPMTELSPYRIHPPHLDHFLVSREGQFRLERLPGGGTRLEGTTWYTNRMWPAPYWHLWSDAIIHRIHLRVLEHIRAIAEQAH